AKRVYDRSKRFHECARFEPVYFVMALPPSFRAASSLTRWLSMVRNNVVVSDGALRRRGLEIAMVSSFEASVETFISEWTRQDPLARDSSYWRWVFGYPWISTNGQDKVAQKRYAFSLFAGVFRQIPVVVRERGTVIACLVLTLRDWRLSLKYAWYHPDRTE